MLTVVFVVAAGSLLAVASVARGVGGSAGLVRLLLGRFTRTGSVLETLQGRVCAEVKGQVVRFRTSGGRHVTPAGVRVLVHEENYRPLWVAKDAVRREVAAELSQVVEVNMPVTFKLLVFRDANARKGAPVVDVWFVGEEPLGPPARPDASGFTASAWVTPDAGVTPGRDHSDTRPGPQATAEPRPADAEPRWVTGDDPAGVHMPTGDDPAGVHMPTGDDPVAGDMVTHPVMTVTLLTPEGAVSAAGDELTLGRSPDCDLVLADSRVSRRHAVIRHAGEGATIELDHAARNGLVLNGRLCTAGQPMPLQDGASLRLFGDTAITAQLWLPVAR